MITGRELYEGSANRVKPKWDDIGDYTKAEWNRMAAEGRTLDEAVDPECLTNPSQS